MQTAITKGRYRARAADDAADLDACLSLRVAAFRGGSGSDVDRFDALCTHIMVEDRASGRLLCCFRLLPLTGTEIDGCYAAQYYELSALQDFQGRMVEMGRFCVAQDVHDPDVVRLAWAAMTAYVDANGVQMLFGCSSFAGTQADRYLDAFDMLATRHLAPKRWLPRVKAPKVFRFARSLTRPLDRKAALMRMPPLLKTYLTMGGWVSDHAVLDEDLGTLHVFTGLEIAAIPPARAKALRALTT